MAYQNVPMTDKDLEVIGWLNAHLNLQSSAAYHALIYEVVTEDLFSPVTPSTPDGVLTENLLIVTNPFNGLTQKFEHKLVMQWPDEALVEISKWLQVGIKQFEYYHEPSKPAPLVLVDGHDTSTCPFNPTPDQMGYLANAHDIYPVGYIWKDAGGSYQKREVGGWAFIPYYRWVKMADLNTREFENASMNVSDEELKKKLDHLNNTLNHATD